MLDLLDFGKNKGVETERLRRIETKMNLILAHLGIECKDPADPSSLSDEVRALADARRKVEAIKLHRAQTYTGLKEAKAAVEAYLEAKPH